MSVTFDEWVNWDEQKIPKRKSRWKTFLSKVQQIENRKGEDFVESNLDHGVHTDVLRDVNPSNGEPK